MKVIRIYTCYHCKEQQQGTEEQQQETNKNEIFFMCSNCNTKNVVKDQPSKYQQHIIPCDIINKHSEFIDSLNTMNNPESYGIAKNIISLDEKLDKLEFTIKEYYYEENNINDIIKVFKEIKNIANDLNNTLNNYYADIKELVIDLDRIFTKL